MKFIIGLGNPGKAYEKTRHNIGMRIVNALAKDYRLKLRRKWGMRSLAASGLIEGIQTTLVCPTTFMNLSGQAAARFIKKGARDLSDVLIVCDDVNLPLGAIRIRPSGSDGGHNGLKSVFASIGTTQIARLRIGIGQPADTTELKEFVLSSFTGKEEKEITQVIAQAKECCTTWLARGIAVAMSNCN